MRPFASTLRETGFSGEVAILVFDDQCVGLRDLIKKYSLSLVPIPRTPKWLPQLIGRRMQNRNRMRYLHHCLAKTLPCFCRQRSALELLSQTLHHFYHISSGRYFLYFRYLNRRREKFSSVLLSDVRDVIFQSDPFRYAVHPGIYCFLDPTVRLGDEHLNTRWTLNLFGDEYFQMRKGSRISCSGTIMGDYDSIIDLLNKMCSVLIQTLPRAVGQIGDDQAAYNYLLWENRIASAIYCENSENAVMTLKNAAPDSLVFDGNGTVLNQDGSPAPVLHQYDFHLMLKGKVR
jgi:hypothetical protein